MDKFKEIKATFRVKSKVGVYDYKFVIERKHSACFKYGDQSCHLLKIYDFKDAHAGEGKDQEVGCPKDRSRKASP